jgi:hypothetical protein
MPIAICALPNGIMSAAIGEEYHAPIGRSVTDFMVVRRREVSLFFCIAKYPSWPFSAAPTVRRRGSYRRNTGRVGTLVLSLKVTH